MMCRFTPERENFTLREVISPSYAHRRLTSLRKVRSSLVASIATAESRFIRSRESKKRESAHLDALPRWRIGRGRRIDKRCVRRETRAAILFRIVNFEHQGLVAPHLRKIEPTVIGVVLQSIGLSHAVRIAALRNEQVFHSDALGIGDRERI
jgi:hypothetical protein